MTPIPVYEFPSFSPILVVGFLGIGMVLIEHSRGSGSSGGDGGGCSSCGGGSGGCSSCGGGCGGGE